MFGFRIVRNRDQFAAGERAPVDRGPTAANLEGLLEVREYYQICENGRALAGLSFRTRKEASARLKGLTGEVERFSNGWYRVERRLPHLPVRNTLGLRKIYADGKIVQCTYVIRKISLKVHMDI